MKQASQILRMVSPKREIVTCMKGIEMAEKTNDLTKIVGAQNVIDDPIILDGYSKDNSFVPSRKPKAVAKPQNADEVQQVVKWANQANTPLVPVSSGAPHFRGDTVPSTGGAVVVDFSGMKRIIKIDRKNRIVIIEPGITFGELQPELAKEGLKLSMPLLPRRSKSVVASFLEREPILLPRRQWSMTDPLRCVEVIWGNGEKFWTGEAGDGNIERLAKRYNALIQPWGPGQTDYHRFLSGAQGTLGFVTWASLRCELLPTLHKFFFVSSQKLDNLIGFAYRLLRFRFADELLLLNGANLAYIFGTVAGQMEAMKDELPAWVLILGVAGRGLLPQERVEYQEKDIGEIAQQFGLKLTSAIPGVNTQQALETLLKPSREPYWKLGYTDGFQDIFFLTTLEKTPDFVGTMHMMAEAYGYSTADIGIYLQPVQQGAGCHCEFTLPYDLGNQREKMKVLFEKASEQLLKQGAYFSRPYAIWADMAYSRDAQSTAVLKKIKKIFDPNNIMNPGKLCF